MTLPLTFPWLTLPPLETSRIHESQIPAFEAFVKRYKIKDLDHPSSFYDYRGAFLAGAKPDKSGHWPDTFKQHGHPTFSVESRYAFPGDPEAGTWKGNTYIPNPRAAEVAHVRALRASAHSVAP